MNPKEPLFQYLRSRMVWVAEVAVPVDLLLLRRVALRGGETTAFAS